MLGHATAALAITRALNTAGQLTLVVTFITAARARTMSITPITVARATMAVDRATRTPVTTRAGPIPIGVMEHSCYTTRIRTVAFIRTAPITTTHTTHQLTAIT